MEKKTPSSRDSNLVPNSDTKDRLAIKTKTIGGESVKPSRGLCEKFRGQEEIASDKCEINWGIS